MSVKELRLSGGTRLHRTTPYEACEVPLVTVITAVLNGVDTIKSCIESVLRQDYPKIEHIILDGGSTDGTLDVLRQYDDRIALWKSAPDRGVYDAWNKALLEARGSWISFLGADDEYLPGAISAYMTLAASNPHAEYMSARVRLVHTSGYQRTAGRPWRWKEFSRWMCVSHVGSMHRRTLYDRLGNYDLSFGSAADYEFLLRARWELATAYMPRLTAIMRLGGLTDGPNAFADATRAKIATGRRNALLATAELRVANVRYFLRPLRRAIGRLVAR